MAVRIVCDGCDAEAEKDDLRPVGKLEPASLYCMACVSHANEYLRLRDLAHEKAARVWQEEAAALSAEFHQMLRVLPDER